METRRQIASIIDRHVRGEGAPKVAVAEWLDVALRTLDRWASDETRLTAAELIDLVAAVGKEDPIRAAAMWRDISALVGQESSPAPRSIPADAIEDKCLAVSAEAGDVSAALRKAVDPNGPGGREILSSEAAVIALEAYDVERAAVAARAAARGVPSPQLALGVR